MGPVALDASVIIGILGADDPHHERALGELRRLNDGRASLQMAASAYAEVMVQPLRAKQAEHVEAFLDKLGVDVVAIDRAAARLAADLRAKHRSLRLGDALALASARIGGAELVTFDDRLRRVALESPR